MTTDDTAEPRHYIAEWRKYKRLTQHRLAELSGVGRTRIAAIETNRRDYVQRNLEALAKALEIEPADLLRPPPKEGEADLPSILAKLDDEAKGRLVRIARTFIEEDEIDDLPAK